MEEEKVVQEIKAEEMNTEDVNTQNTAENQIAAEQEQVYRDLSEDYSKKKKKFWGNFIELIIGGILLVICINYLRTHPAEKTSIFSGLEVIVQRIEITVSNIFHKQGDDLKEKYDLEKSLQELQTLIEQGKCGTLDDAKAVTEHLSDIRMLTLDEFSQQKAIFVSFARSLYTKVKDKCNDDTLSGANGMDVGTTGGNTGTGN